MKRISASITLFTRLPLWRWIKIPAESYSSAVVYWPLTGWLTGSVMACCILIFSMILPVSVSVVLAVIARLLMTGALHEDGLADFCDGFGGGKDKESILRIMKDSSTGAYGVIGLVSYFLLLWCLLTAMPPFYSALAIFGSDAFSKCCASQLTNLLPYARPEGAKNRISYAGMNFSQIMINIITGILPFSFLVYFMPWSAIALILPVSLLLFISMYLRKKIGGYTGDCCGATFLICEVALITGIVMVFKTVGF